MSSESLKICLASFLLKSDEFTSFFKSVLIRILNKINRLNLWFMELKLRCDSRFQNAFCVFKVITLVGSNQGNFFENATACSKSTLKTTVATQL